MGDREYARRVLVIAHGLGRFPAEWAACASALDARVPDLPQLRRDDAPPDHAAAIPVLLGALDASGIAAATWLGHSGGAHLALDTAVAHPDRVEALVLVAAAPKRSLLAQVTCEVLVIQGALAPIVMAPQDNVEVVAIAGAIHDPHLEAADAFIAAVRAFRERVADRRR